MTKKALGIFPTYPGSYAIPATPNDRANWLDALPRRGFPTVATLDGAGVTRSAIIARIQQFVASLVAGDSVAIVYCGHGASVGGRQCIVGTDFQPVWDYEIKGMLSLLPPAVKADVVLECCYAGTGTYDAMFSRDPVAPPKVDEHVKPVMFNSKNLALSALSKDAASRGTIVIPPRWREWAACGPTQNNYMAQFGGKWMCLFTVYLTWALKTYPTMSAAQLIEIVKPYVIRFAPNQTPQLTGASLEQVPF